MAMTEQADKRRDDERHDRTTRRDALLAGATALAAPAAASAAPVVAAGNEGSRISHGKSVASIAVIAPATVLRLEEKLRQRVVLQDHVLATIANAVRRWWSGLADPRLPIGSFLFLGPQGVGKTALAKALAEHLFGSEQAMVRLDMRKYAGGDSVAQRLVEELSAVVAPRPYHVLLFEEVEKAHADVLRSIQRILETGRLTDGNGQTVDFRNTVIIMTTGVSGGTALQRAFPPEFLGRLGEVVTFNQVDRTQVERLLAAIRAGS